MFSVGCLLIGLRIFSTVPARSPGHVGYAFATCGRVTLFGLFVFNVTVFV